MCWLVRFVCDLLCDDACGVCHCVWFINVNCLCVLFVAYCDVVPFVIGLRVLLCACVCVCLLFCYVFACFA